MLFYARFNRYGDYWRLAIKQSHFLKEDKIENVKMDYKQLKIMALALSLPGAIVATAYLYEVVIENAYMPKMTALILLGIILMCYIALIIRRLYK